MKINEYVIMARRQSGLTQAELAQRAGVSEDEVRRAELGDEEVEDTSVWAIIAAAYGMGVEDVNMEMEAEDGSEDETG